MAFLTCDFFSDTLGLSTSMRVILPQRTTQQIGMASVDAAGSGQGAPVLYLLHGLSDDASVWSRRTSIERYVADLGLAVVMPQVGRSFYTDTANGERCWTFLSEELPHLVSQFFQVSTAREDTFVAGLSMGGYGAFKWALRQPERFAAAASLSGALDLAGRSLEDPATFRPVFGDRPVAGTDDDLLHLVSQADPALVPPLYACCGTSDFLYESNLTFEEVARRGGLDLTLETAPGTHDWAFWDRRIQDVLAWLPLRR